MGSEGKEGKEVSRRTLSIIRDMDRILDQLLKGYLSSTMLQISEKYFMIGSVNPMVSAHCHKVKAILCVIANR